MRRRSPTLAARRRRRATRSVSIGSNRSTDRKVSTTWPTGRRLSSRVPTMSQDRTMTAAPNWDGEYAATRAELHRVAAHVIARRRFVVTERFGLRVTPGGFGTPLFGDD